MGSAVENSAVPRNVDSFAGADISNCWAANNLEQLVKPCETKTVFQLICQLKKKNVPVLIGTFFWLGL